MAKPRTEAELQRELEALRGRVDAVAPGRGPRASDPFLRLSERVGNVGSWQWDVATGAVQWSPEMYRIHGIGPGDFGNRVEEYVNFVHPDDRARVQAVIESLMHGGESRAVEYRVVRPDGVTRHVLGTSVMTNTDGTTYLIGTVQDMTLLKQVEAALEVTEERFRLAVDGSGGGLWDIRLDPTTGEPVDAGTYLSARLKALVGFEDQELPSTIEAWRALVHPDDRDHLDGSRRSALETPRQPQEIEYRVRHRDGRYRWFHARGHVQRDRQGRPIRWTGIDWDVTERKQREGLVHAIRAGIEAATGEGFFQAIVGSLAESLGAAYAFIAEFDPQDPARSNTVAVWAHGELVDNFTYALPGTPCAEVATNVRRLVPSRLRELYPDDALAHQLTAESYCGTALTDADGQVLGLLVVADTKAFVHPELVQSTIQIFASRVAAELERQIAGRALQASEERYRSLFEGSRDAIYLSTRDGTMLDINPAGVALLGYSARALKRMHTRDLYAEPAERAAFQRQIEEKGAVTDYPVRLRRSDGTVIDCLLSSSVRRDGDGRVTGYQGVIRDVTERLRMEAALRHNEHRLRLITEQIPGIVWVADRQTRIQSLLGGSSARLVPSGVAAVGSAVTDLFGGANASVVATAHQAALSGAAAPYETVLDDHVYECVVQPLRDDAGAIEGVIGVGLDVTARRRAEDALAVHEAYFSNLFEHAPDAVVILDESYRIERINGSFQRMFGYTIDECRGSFNLLLPPDRKPEVEMIISELEQGRNVSLESKRRAKDGRLLDVSILASPIMRDGRLVGTYGSYRDIGEQMRATALVQESRERLRNLAARLHQVREEERSLIAREIHDELGQALTGIKMDVAWLKNRHAPSDSVVAERFRSIDELLGHTIDVVRNLTGRLRPALLDDLGLGAAVEWQAQDFAHRTGIHLECTVPEGDVRLEPGRATSVFRIFQEALTNVARHAEAEHVHTRLEVSDAQIRLTVEDDGRGIGDGDVNSVMSLGIIGMRERAGAFGGRVTIQRRSEGGTRLSVIMPRAGTLRVAETP